MFESRSPCIRVLIYIRLIAEDSWRPDHALGPHEPTALSFDTIKLVIYVLEIGSTFLIPAVVDGVGHGACIALAVS